MRIPSEEIRAFSHPPGLNHAPTRASMILYRYAEATSDLSPSSNEILLPPQPSHLVRSSVYSTSGDSIVTLSSDSKYPLTSSLNGERGLVAYAYDPDSDEKSPPDEEDMMHDPAQRYHHDLRKNGKGGRSFNGRGFFNIGLLVVMVIAILSLFVGYPAMAFYRDNGRIMLITGNIAINSTGQLPLSAFTPGDDGLTGSTASFIDQSTPSDAFGFTGMNNVDYVLVFSDEFNYTGSTYQRNDNPFWIGRDSGQSSPDLITAANSQLEFNITTTASGQFVGGILDSTIPFCLGHGFIVVGMQAADGSEAQLFWAGSWQYTNAAASNFVPGGSSLNTDLSVSFSVGVLANKIPRGTSPDSLASTYSIDYVRYYGRKVDPLLSGSEGCDFRRARSTTVTLDLLNPPRP